MDRVWVHKAVNWTDRPLLRPWPCQRSTNRGRRFYADPTSGQVTHRLESCIVQNHHGQIPHKIGKATFIQCYAPTNEADDDAKDAFYERLQVVIDEATKKDLLLLFGDLDAKVGSDNTSFETVMGTHGIGEMNENGELFADFCSFNKLVTGGSVYPHKKV